MEPSDVYQINLAAAALAFALFSFLVATAQAAGQYVSTADGYTRCKATLVGHWARRVRLRWRWSQLRFESMFTAPEIFLSSYRYEPDQDIIADDTREDLEWVAAPGAYRKKGIPVTSRPFLKIAPRPIKELDQRYRLPESQDLACWLYLLRSIHESEKQRQDIGLCEPMNGAKYFSPVCRLQERSWDFMSPEVVRPLARTTVSDIAIIARRLGMTWRTFQPDEGVMSAEGNGHLVYSTFVRSIGVILHYMSIGPGLSQSGDSSAAQGEVPKDKLFIPTREVDMLGFGIVAGCKRLGIPDYRMSDIDDVYWTLNHLDSSGRASNVIKDVRSIEKHCLFGFSDLIPMAAPMFRLRGTTLTCVPTPSEYCVGLTCHQEGFVVFHHRLREHIQNSQNRVTESMTWVLKQYETLQAAYAEWECEVEANSNGGERSLVFLESVHDLWDNTTAYFELLQSSKQPLKYTDLMAAHIKHAVGYWNDAWANIRGDDKRECHDHYGLRDWIAEGAHVYWDYVPSIAREVNRKSHVEGHLVYEAWIMLMFRAFCWWRCHYMMPGENMISNPQRLSSRYWDSKQPVFIG